MRTEYPQLLLFFTITGVFWWGWACIKLIDAYAKARAEKRGEVYYSTLSGRTYDFRKKSYNEMEPGKQYTVDLSDTAEKDVADKPKKWEKLNENTDDNSKDI